MFPIAVCYRDQGPRETLSRRTNPIRRHIKTSSRYKVAIVETIRDISRQAYPPALEEAEPSGQSAVSSGERRQARTHAHAFAHAIANIPARR